MSISSQEMDSPAQSNFSARKLVRLLVMFGLMIHLCASFHGVVRRAEGHASDGALYYAQASPSVRSHTLSRDQSTMM